MCGNQDQANNCPDERRQNMLNEFKNLIDCIEKTETSRPRTPTCIYQPCISPCVMMPCPVQQPEPPAAPSRRRLVCPSLPPYERLPCRPSHPQPIQQTVHSSQNNSQCAPVQMQCGSELPTCMYVQCDPPTHVYKNPTYQPWPPGPECPKPKVSHHPGTRIPPVISELKGGQRLTRCDCMRYNGLQDECQLSQCGIPECLTVPPTCIPSGGPGPRRGNANQPQLCCPQGYAPYLVMPPCNNNSPPAPQQQNMCMPQCFADPCMAQTMCCYNYPNN